MPEHRHLVIEIRQIWGSMASPPCLQEHGVARPTIQQMRNGQTPNEKRQPDRGRPQRKNRILVQIEALPSDPRVMSNGMCTGCRPRTCKRVRRAHTINTMNLPVKSSSRRKILPGQPSWMAIRQIEEATETDKRTIGFEDWWPAKVAFP